MDLNEQDTKSFGKSKSTPPVSESSKHVFNPYRTATDDGWVEGFKEDEVCDALTANPPPKGPPLVLGAFQQNQREEVRGSVVAASLSDQGSHQTNVIGPSSTPTSPQSDDATSNQLTLFAEASPAKTSAWLENVLAWLESEAGYGTNSIASLLNSLPVGWSLKTSPAFSAATTERTWPWFSEGWRNSGMGGPSGSWTLNTSEWPNDGVACSLSDILEAPGPHLQKYCLSPKAAAGILRRAERRGKQLPAPLEAALASVAGPQTQTE